VPEQPASNQPRAPTEEASDGHGSAPGRGQPVLLADDEQRRRAADRSGAAESVQCRQHELRFLERQTRVGTQAGMYADRATDKAVGVGIASQQQGAPSIDQRQRREFEDEHPGRVEVLGG
jgi:hypothetical protein